MKRIIFSILSFVIGLGLWSPVVSANEKPKVTVTTSFLADMVQNIAGDEVELELLIPAGSDPHLYQPKAQDLNKISTADIVLYHGLHFEGKMVDVLEQYGVAVTKDFKENQIGEMEEDGQKEVDPHFWFDIDLYKQATITASNALQEKFPELKETFERNTEQYLNELDQLKSWVATELEKLPVEQRNLVTPHDAFNYFAKSNDFVVYAPQGVSTDSEVSNQQISETVDFIIDNKVPAIFVESTTNPDRMKKLQEAVKAKGGSVEVVMNEDEALFSDSLAPAGQPGDNYIAMYQHNIKVIIQHLAK